MREGKPRCGGSGSRSGPRGTDPTLDRPRSPVAQRMMRPLLIGEDEVPLEASPKLRYRLVAPDGNVLVLHAPSEPLHEHVAQRTPTAVHAHRHTGRPQPPGEPTRRELSPPWSLSKTSDLLDPDPYSSTSRQNEPSSVLDSFQVITKRLYRSITAARSMNFEAIGI